MPISSDFAKVSVSALQVGQQTLLNERQFTEQKQLQAQVIQASADSNPMESNAGNSGREFAFSQTTVNDSMVEDVNVKVRQLSLGVSFELTSDNDNVIKVIDQETGDLVRQIPSEEFLQMSQRLDEIFGELNHLKGNLINNKV